VAWANPLSRERGGDEPPGNHHTPHHAVRPLVGHGVPDERPRFLDWTLRGWGQSWHLWRTVRPALWHDE